MQRQHFPKPSMAIIFLHSSHIHLSDPLVGSYITAGGSKMHARCFTCSECSRPICDASGSASPYYEKQGKFYCRSDYIRLYMPVCAVRTHIFVAYVARTQRLPQVCCVSVTSKYTGNDWGQVMCSLHAPESSQCFDCGRYITLASEPPKRQRLLQFLSSSAREALFSDVAHSGSPNPPAAPAAAGSHVTCIVDMGRIVDGRTQVRPSFINIHIHTAFYFDMCFVSSALWPSCNLRLIPNDSVYTAALTPPRASVTCAAFGAV